MPARGPAVHPDGGRVKHRLEFHTNRRAGPFLRNIEDALVPAHAVEPGALRGCLPGVRDRDCLPLRLGIKAEIPKAIERDALINGATRGSGGSGLAQSGRGSSQCQAIQEGAARGNQRSRNPPARPMSKGRLLREPLEEAIRVPAPWKLQPTLELWPSANGGAGLSPMPLSFRPQV